MNEKSSRRNFISSLARWTCLTMLGGFVGKTALRSVLQGTDVSGQRFTFCKQCPTLRYCSLPEGIRARVRLGGATFAARSRRRLAQAPRQCPFYDL